MTDAEMLPWTVIARRGHGQRWLLLNRDVGNKSSVWVIGPNDNVPRQLPRSWVLARCDAVGRLKSSEDIRRWNHGQCI